MSLPILTRLLPLLLLSAVIARADDAPPATDAAAAPPTIDPTYGMPVPSNVAGKSLNDAPNLGHLPIPPVSAEAVSQPETIKGVETLTGTGPAKLEVTPSTTPAEVPAPAPDAAASTNAPAATPPTTIPGVLIDFGKELTGRVEVCGSPSGTPINIWTGESRGEAMHEMDNDKEGNKWRIGTHFTLQGDKPVTTGNTGLRFVKLTFPDKTPVTITKVIINHKYYPVEYKGSFSCSDPALTKIWYIGAYTAHLCMQEDLLDGPKRDHSRWIGDIQVSGEVASNVFADTFLIEHTISRLRNDAQHGRPATEKPAEHINQIPGYSSAWICTLADFYRHSGDTDYLKSQHDLLVSMLEFQHGDLDEHGVFSYHQGGWKFTDWSPFGDEMACPHLFLTLAAREGAFLLREMGDTANADKNAAWSEDLKSAGQKSFSKNNIYSSYRQENAMAIFSGTATPEQTSAIYSQILDPKSSAWDKPATPYYNNFALFAMSYAGHDAEALEIIRKFWGGMIDEGATTFWEAYDPKWTKGKEDAHAYLQADGVVGYFVSLCHAWSAGPTNWLTERLLGVRPTSGGFKTADIAPNLCDLTWAEGDVPTPHGKIHIRVEKADSGPSPMTVHLTLPADIDATVSLPGSSLTLNGGAAQSTPIDGGRSAIHVTEAGTYVITGS